MKEVAEIGRVGGGMRESEDHQEETEDIVEGKPRPSIVLRLDDVFHMP